MELVNPDRHIAGQGTTEEDWQDWMREHPLRQVDPRTLVTAGARVFVVAPHPDDEVLSAGGLMQVFAALGCAVNVVAVTDGDASHPGSTEWPAARLATERPRESVAALTHLAPDARMHRLRLPDGGVSARETMLADRLAELLDPDDLVLTTWRLDGHPDHEATGRACARACESRGARLAELPVWAWHWARPDDPRLPWNRAVAVSLSAAQLATKRKAVACFRSQLDPDTSTGAAPILPETAMRRLLRPYEVMFI